jgi:hypothetical protein
MPQLTLSGSCLCGSVQYQVSGDAERFYHCHCRRCRKSTGTGHASNLLISRAQLHFSAGESLLKRYKVPEAKRFTRQFCGECGSPVPRYVAEIDSVVVPAGSVDGDIALRPQARIFWDSRAAWSCDGDDLPRYTEYPG